MLSYDNSWSQDNNMPIRMRIEIALSDLINNCISLEKKLKEEGFITK
tara:strand:+ start:3149 stop:3289 length:141 start_codon:yes stop_codon:yes gene_type:complete